MKIIVGLGNPGKEYKNTRHNAGWLVLDALAKKLEIGNWKLKKKFKVEIAEVECEREKVVLVKPQTFMNDSGMAVAKIVKLLNCQMVELSQDLWLVHDDLDLELGEIKIVRDRGAGGHHGVESVINHLKIQDFIRFRIGIRTKKKEECILSGRDYVLGEFRGKDREIFDKSIEKCVEAVLYGLENGIEEVMNRYN